MFMLNLKVTFSSLPNEYLTYALTEKWLLSNVDFFIFCKVPWIWIPVISQSILCLFLAIFSKARNAFRKCWYSNASQSVKSGKYPPTTDIIFVSTRRMELWMKRKYTPVFTMDLCTRVITIVLIIFQVSKTTLTITLDKLFV